MRPQRSLSFLVLLLLAVACGDDTTGPENPGNLADERVSITNDTSGLTKRVHYLQEALAVEDDSGGVPKAARGRDFSLKLVAEVSPPTHEGITLQANSVFVRGNFAVVGYNVRGATRLGAIDVFNITNKRRPRLESSAVFVDSDVNAVSYHDGWVLVAEATEDPSFEFPAVFEILQLIGHHLILDGKVRGPLTSFAGTCVRGGDAAAYAASGDGGGVTVLELGTWEATNFLELDDARWVDAVDGRIIVVQGTPGRMSVYDELTLSLEGSYSFAGADVPESKSTVEVVGGKAFIAAGTGGLQVLSINNGVVLGSVPRPDPASLGLDPAVVVTNAAALDDDLVFLSNGEAGVYVAQGVEPFEDSGGEAALDIALLGRLAFDELQSANHVAFKNDYLIVAAGLGGVKIVQIDD